MNSSTHIYFDLDGTLTDPVEGICNCIHTIIYNKDMKSNNIGTLVDVPKIGMHTENR